MTNGDFRVTLLYFAWVRQRIGRAGEEMSLPAHVRTVADAMEFLKARGPGYAEAFRDRDRLRAAVNETHAGFDAAIRGGDEIAFFPPVTGG